MLTRRTFLQSSLLVLTVPAGNAVNAASRFPGPVTLRTFSTCGCADSEQFQNVFPANCEIIGRDIGDCLQLFPDNSEKNNTSVLFGLTKDTDQLLIGQLAIEGGYRPIYTGRHQYTPAHLQHVLNGSRETMAELQSVLHDAEKYWSKALARNLSRVIASTGLEQHRELSSPVTRPQGSPGYLVSWVYRKG